MIKPYHLLIWGAICFGLGIWFISCQNNQEVLPDPQIHRLKEEIGWRAFRENKIQDTLKRERSEKQILAKENIDLRTKAQKAEARYNQVKRAVPVTLHDTITFLMRDTAACDSALLWSKELVSGLSIEIMTDNAIIENLDSLNSDLREDKKELKEIDSLHIQTEKQLRKIGRKKFFKGLGIGGALGIILALLL